MTDSELYLEVVARLRDIVADADADTLVPACPAWRVRDVIAHLAGLAEDWASGDLAHYASDAWTAQQVQRFKDAPVADVLSQLWVAAQDLAKLPDNPAMGPPARFAFGDAVVHEADIRAALDAGRVPPDAVAASLKGQIAMWRATLKRAGAPTLLATTELRDWWLGTPDDPSHIEVTTSAYDLFRALAGRRSEDQVRNWRWSQDPTSVLVAKLPYPFEFAVASIED